MKMLSKLSRNLGLILIPVIIIAAAGIAGGYWFISSSASDAPSHDEMIRFFNEHRAQFDALRDGYSNAELRQLGIQVDGMRPADTSAKYFPTWSEGTIGTSLEKGYVYSEQPLSTTYRDDGSVLLEYRLIDSGWYLYIYSDP
jgi:hypothetical protein